MAGVGALAFLIFIDHRHELAHPLNVHPRTLARLQPQRLPHLSDADPAILLQDLSPVELHQLLPVGLDQLPSLPQAPLVAAVLLLKVDGEVSIFPSLPRFLRKGLLTNWLL
jgi:hypothetical protein